MSTTAPKPATTSIPVPLSAPEFEAFLLPHLSRPKRGPKGTLGSSRLLHLLLWGLSPAMQWQGWPVPHDAAGKPAMHDTTVSTVLAPWADDGSRWPACGARVRPRAGEQPRARRVLQGDGTHPVATQGALGLATRAPSTSKEKRSAP